MAESAVPNITAEDLKDYAIKVEGATNEVYFDSASFVFDSKTALKVYFAASENATLTVNGKKFEKTAEDGYYYVKLLVSPVDTGDVFTITVTDGETTATAQLSAYSAIYAALSASNSLEEDLVSLLKVYAHYAQCALKYATER